MDSRNCQYSVEAAILHTGHTTRAGHYTCLLREDGTSLFCGDNVAPQRLDPRALAHSYAVHRDGVLGRFTC